MKAFPQIYIYIFHLILAKDCGPIGTPLNGTKRGRQTTYPNKVIFTCDDGFHLKGLNVRECQSDGAWSGVETFCEGKTTLFKPKKRPLW